MAQGIFAKCFYKFDFWHRMKAASFGGMNDSLRSELGSEADDDRKAAEREAIALVLDYRTCAAGEKPATTS